MITSGLSYPICSLASKSVKAFSDKAILWQHMTEVTRQQDQPTRLTSSLPSCIAFALPWLPSLYHCGSAHFQVHLLQTFLEGCFSCQVRCLPACLAECVGAAVFWLFALQATPASILPVAAQIGGLSSCGICLFFLSVSL